MSCPEKILSSLAQLPLFCEMSLEEIGHIAQGTREINLARGDILFQCGDPSNGFYMVMQGQIKLALTSPQGIEKVVELFESGQSFGEAVMFIDKPYPVYAQALTDSLVLHINKNVIIGRIESDSAFSRKMLAGLSFRLHRMIHYVESISLRSSAHRVVDYLLHDLEETNDEQGICISLSANKNVIASNINVTPETFSRILHNLTDAGLIKVEGKEIYIRDVGKLRAYDD